MREETPKGIKIFKKYVGPSLITGLSSNIKSKHFYLIKLKLKETSEMGKGSKKNQNMVPL